MECIHVKHVKGVLKQFIIDIECHKTKHMFRNAQPLPILMDKALDTSIGVRYNPVLINQLSNL